MCIPQPHHVAFPHEGHLHKVHMFDEAFGFNRWKYYEQARKFGRCIRFVKNRSSGSHFATKDRSLSRFSSSVNALLLVSIQCIKYDPQ
jgi:hypothetical protein